MNDNILPSVTLSVFENRDIRPELVERTTGNQSADHFWAPDVSSLLNAINTFGVGPKNDFHAMVLTIPRLRLLPSQPTCQELDELGWAKLSNNPDELRRQMTKFNAWPEIHKFFTERQANFEQAMVEFNGMIQRFPNSGLMHAHKASFMEYGSREFRFRCDTILEGALYHIEQARRLGFTPPAVDLCHEMILTRLGRFSDAFNLVLSLNCGEALKRVRLIPILAHWGVPDAYQNAVFLKGNFPSDSMAQANAAVAFACLGDLDAARQCLGAVDFNDYPLAMVVKAWELSIAGSGESAKTFIEEAYRKNPDSLFTNLVYHLVMYDQQADSPQLKFVLAQLPPKSQLMRNLLTRWMPNASN